MTASFRRLPLISALALVFAVASAGVSFAQTTPPLTSRSLLTSVQFDLSASAQPLLAGDASDSRLAVAQSSQNRSRGIGFGVEGGISRNSVSGDDNEGLEPNTGTMVGIWVGGNKGGRIGFTGEFLYVFRKSDTPFGELKYPALEIPAVFHVNFGGGDPEDPMGYVLVGPVFTINLKQKLDGVDISDDFNGADIGVMVGGGVEFFRLAFEVRYNMGLRSISSDGSLSDIKNRAFEFVVKFRISGS